MERFTFPVSVLLECREIARSGWSVPHWELVGVVGGNPDAAAKEPLKISEESGRARYLWGGLKLELFKDESETYWHNLTAEKPLIFVICRDREEGDDGGDGNRAMEPVIVSVSGDDASAHTEIDDLVLSAPMPAEIYRWVEEFVVEHFQPAPRKKRKRKNWVEDENDQRQA